MEAQRQTRTCDRNRPEPNEENPTPKGARQIVVPMTQDIYNRLWRDPQKLREHLDPIIKQLPEIFPKGTSQGYQLHGLLPESKKMPGIQLRQFRVDGVAYSLRPSFVFAYMTGTVDELEDGLFLLSMRNPAWVVARVCGKDPMFWHRHLERMGRNSLLGTTVRSADALPQHGAADEHHLKWCGEKGYLAMIAAGGCILGAALTDSVDEEHLTEAYGVCRAEAADVDPNWKLQTMNLDGFGATRNAIKKLFSGVTMLLCFLHGFLKIRDRSGKDRELHHRVWRVYWSKTKQQFSRRLGALKRWVKTRDMKPSVLEYLKKLYSKKAEYLKSYDHPGAYRTSNQIDRPMNRVHRLLYSSRGLHGHQVSSERRLRGLCLLENYRPFARRSGETRPYQCPADRLNQGAYDDHWLHNLQIAASLQGFHHNT